MEPLTTLASRAARRILLRGFVFALGPCLAMAGILGILAALADRLVGPGLAWWWFVAAPGGLGVLSAGVIAWMRRATPIMAASEVDDALRLQDRLSSALDLGQRAPDDPFVVIALRQSRELASKIRLSQALPIRIRPAWWSWTGALGAAAAIALLVPPMHLLVDQQAQAEQAQLEQERSAAEQALEEAVRFDQDEMTEAEIEPDAPMADLASDEDLRRLDRIREQLNKGEMRPDEAVTEAARVFEEQARRLEQEARDRQKAAEALQKRLASLNSGGEQSGRVSDMAEALSRGDTQAAQRAAEALEREMAGMSEQERAETLERLRELADQIDRQGQQAQEDLDRARERAMESLMDRGLSEEDAQNLLDETDPDALRETLESMGMDPNDAADLARRLSEQNRQRQAEQQAAEQLQELADSMRDAAEDLDREQDASEDSSESPDSQQGQQGQQGQDNQTGEQSQQDSEQANAESRESQTGEQREQESGQQRESREQTGEQGQRDQQQQQQKKDQGEPQEGAECEQGACESGESGKQGESQTDGSGQSTSPTGPQQTRQEQREGQSGEAREDRQQDPQQQGQQQGQQQQGQPQDQQPSDATTSQGECSECDGSGSGAGQERQTSGGSAGKEGAGFDRLRKQLDQMNNQQRSWQNSEQRAADARSRAQRLLDGLSPEERRQLEQLARAQQRESGAEPPGADRESVDLRRQGDGGRVVAQVEGQDSTDGQREVRVSRRALLDELREAQAAGERARDDRTAATRRYTNVERYFQTTSQRLRERAAAESEENSGGSGGTSGGTSGEASGGGGGGDE